MTPQSQGRQRHGYVFIPWISTVIESTVLEVVSQRVMNEQKNDKIQHLVSVHVHDVFHNTAHAVLAAVTQKSKLTTIQATYAFNFQGHAEVPRASRWQLSRVPV